MIRAIRFAIFSCLILAAACSSADGDDSDSAGGSTSAGRPATGSAGEGSREGSANGGATGTSGPSTGGMTSASGDKVIVNGALNGETLELRDGYAYTITASSRNTVMGVVSLVNLANACDRALQSTETGMNVANTRFIGLFFGNNGTQVLETGTYTLNYNWDEEDAPASGRFASTGFFWSDSECENDDLESTTGSIDITRVDATGVAGTFTVFFDSEEVSGSFDVPSCQQLLEVTSPDVPEQCVDAD